MVKLRLEPRHSGSRIPALNPSSSSSFCSAFFLRKWVELIVVNVTVDDWVRMLVQVIAAQGYVTGPFLESSMGFLTCSVNEDGTHSWACTPVRVPGKACTPVVGLHGISVDSFWCWDSPFLKILGIRRYIFSLFLASFAGLAALMPLQSPLPLHRAARELALGGNRRKVWAMCTWGSLRASDIAVL